MLQPNNGGRSSVFLPFFVPNNTESIEIVSELVQCSTVESPSL